MNLKTSNVVVNKTSQEVFDFLYEVKNYEKLMPENISKFESLGDDGFVFALKGMPEIELKRKEAMAPQKLVLSAAGGKLDFTLYNTIVELDENRSEVQFEFEGQFNTMMTMMIKGPISKFIETLVTNIPKAI